MNGMGRHFLDSVEYPLSETQTQLAEEILPYGTLWEYVNSSFANGFINAGRLKAAVLCNRYCGLDEVDEDRQFTYGGKKFKTKRQALVAWQADPNPFHIDFGGFRDDVLLLNHLGEDAYVYIWLDCDVSDCCVGRFRSSESLSILEADLLYTATEVGQRSGQKDSPTLFDVRRLRGWLRF